jgi:hypothetical protein
MKLACKLLVSIALLQNVAWAQVPGQTAAPGPEIEVVDGKISMTAMGVPLSRIVSMVDRAVGLQSKVAPEVASRLVNVRFKELPVKDAVQKIFEGQPLNYMLIEGKGIHVTGVAQGAGTAASSFDSPPPVAQTPLPNVQAVQPTNPVQVNPGQANPNPNQVNPTTGQPVSPTANTPFPPAGAPVPTANPAATGTPGAASAPGQMPPPIGANAPMIPIIAQPAAGLPVVVPGPAPAPSSQPAGPGTLGATPGTVR